MQKRAIGAGRCKERSYADHIFIQIYSRMHHFVVKFSKFSSPQAARGHWPLVKILRTPLFACVSNWSSVLWTRLMGCLQFTNTTRRTTACTTGCIVYTHFTNVRVLQVLATRTERVHVRRPRCWRKFAVTIWCQTAAHSSCLTSNFRYYLFTCLNTRRDYVEGL